MGHTLFSSNSSQLSYLNKLFDNLLSNFKDRYAWIPFKGQQPLERLKSFFFTCAICHNMNWDFLCKSVMPRIQEETNGFELDELVKIDTETMAKYFEDYEKPHKIEADRRSRILRNLAQELSAEGKEFFTNLISATSLNGENGFLTRVEKFSVFSEDPLRKKSNLLAQMAISEGIIKVIDENKLEPAIDYHIMRVYLRTGRVNVRDVQTIKRLNSQDDFSLEEITELRKEIRKAMIGFCEKYNRSIVQLGFIDWVIGREYCEPNKPLCSSCPIVDICLSSKSTEGKLVIEPKSSHGFY